MTKFSVRYGWRLLCGWLPPAGTTLPGFIAVFADGAYGDRSWAAKVAPAGEPLEAGFASPVTPWVCAGISEIISVWFSSPALSPGKEIGAPEP
jgi:hypothetical protein